MPFLDCDIVTDYTLYLNVAGEVVTAQTFPKKVSCVIVTDNTFQFKVVGKKVTVQTLPTKVAS